MRKPSKILNARIPAGDYEGLEVVVESNRYTSVSDAVEHAIKQLLGKENIAPCRYCGKMKFLDTDGLCQICAQMREAGT